MNFVRDQGIVVRITRKGVRTAISSGDDCSSLDSKEMARFGINVFVVLEKQDHKLYIEDIR